MTLILSGTDGLSDVDGSAATPAIRGTDANTGIFFGTDIIGFSEGGVEAMRINASGNVEMVGTLTTASKGIAKASLPAGTVLQVVNYQFATIVTTTTQIPLDNTIPQITEGGQFLTLAITPTSATSKLFIQINYFYAASAAAHVTTALFQDSTANAIAAQTTYLSVGGENQQAAIDYYMTSGTTSSTTFTARIGANNSNTITVNGNTSAALFGGVGLSSMTIMEIAA